VAAQRQETILPVCKADRQALYRVQARSRSSCALTVLIILLAVAAIAAVFLLLWRG
jgi:hypothetical protein